MGYRCMRWLLDPPASLLCAGLRSRPNSCAASSYQQRWLSLKDLAAAFGEMGSTNAPSLNTVRPSSAVTGCNPAGAELLENSSGCLSKKPLRKQESKAALASSPSGAANRTKNTAAALKWQGGNGMYRSQSPNRTSSPPTSLPAVVTVAAPAPSPPLTPILTLSPVYAQHLSTLVESQLLTEMGNSYRRVHYSHMIQCLMELSLRLLRKTGDLGPFHISDEEAVGGVAGNCRSGDATCRSDRLLDAALRCLTKMNLAQLEPDITAALRGLREANGADEAQHATQELGASEAANATEYFALTGKSLSHCLGLQLLSWVSARVATFDAVTSISSLHLLVQQRLFYSDDILATLADNITINSGGHRRPMVDPITPQKCEGAPLSLNQFAIFFDTMARCEAHIHVVRGRWNSSRQQLSAQRHAQRKHREQLSVRGVYFLDNEEEEEAVVRNGRILTHLPVHATGASRVAPAQLPVSASRDIAWVDTHHPLCSQEVYDCMVKRLMLLVERRRAALVGAIEEERVSAQASSSDTLFPTVDARRLHDEALPNSSSASASRRSAAVLATGGVWSDLDTVSFFFLTRALGRLECFHESLVPTLLPGMAQFLRHHPEQYLGIVTLVGRRENTAADPELTQVLLETLITRLRKRTTAFTRNPAAGLHRLGAAKEEMCDGEGAETLGSAPSRRGNALDSLLHSSSGGDEAALLSDEEPATLFQGTAVKQKSAPVALHQTQKTSPQQQHHFFMVSLIDIFTFHRFLEHLRHQYFLTMTLLSNNDVVVAAGGTGGTQKRHFTTLSSASPVSPPMISAAAMRRNMTTLCELLYNDVHRGVPSIASFFRLTPTVLEETLEQILFVNNLLVAHAAGHHGKTHLTENDEGETIGDTPAGIDAETVLRLQHHPLLIELAYAWTRLVAHSHLVVSKSGQRGKILSALLETGVLERVVVVPRRNGRNGGGGGRYRPQHQQQRQRSGKEGEVVASRYDSQIPARSPVSEFGRDANDYAQRTVYYVIPLVLQQQCAPRVLASVCQSLLDGEARRRCGRRNEQIDEDRGAASARSSLVDILQEDARDVGKAKKQKLLLARHFSRFSTAISR